MIIFRFRFYKLRSFVISNILITTIGGLSEYGVFYCLMDHPYGTFLLSFVVFLQVAI